MMMGEGPESETALYDNSEFFAAYHQMRELGGTLNDIVEMPALKSLMPPLKSFAAADLGCGAGEMCRWLARQGAAMVIGFDASKKMLDQARQRTEANNIRYERANLNSLDLGRDQFDLIISGLALHYVADFQKLARRVRQALRPGGIFIFSVEHPIITCGQRSWICGDQGERLHWPVDRYLDEGSRAVNWLGFDDVPRQHRTVAGYVSGILTAGLVLRSLLEPGPSEVDIAAWPRLADQRRRPPFLVIRADKPA